MAQDKLVFLCLGVALRLLYKTPFLIQRDLRVSANKVAIGFEHGGHYTVRIFETKSKICDVSAQGALKRIVKTFQTVFSGGISSFFVSVRYITMPNIVMRKSTLVVVGPRPSPPSL